jgi:hypothetical protein
MKSKHSIIYRYFPEYVRSALYSRLSVAPCAAAQGATDWRLPYHGTYYHTLRLVPLVVHAVFRTPDDGRKVYPKHVEEYYSEI